MLTKTELNRDFKWQGRDDVEDGQQGKRWHHVLANSTPDTDIGLLGFSCDLGVAENKGRVGAKEGPDAIRSALANFAYHGQASVYDHGNLIANAPLETSQQSYASHLTDALQKHRLVIALGGGHEIAWGTYQGLYSYLTQQQPAKKIAIINFDAHFDLRKPAPNPSSGTPFYQVAKHCESNARPFHYACLGVAEPANTQALFDRADGLDVVYLRDQHCTVENAQAKLAPMLTDIDELYVTVCLDVFSADIAPGVSAPASLGVDRQFVIDMLRWLWQQQAQMNYCWRVMDIAEMNPQFDIDNRTAKLAARLIYETTRML
ncbi:formimidoylglutamase [Aliiglaciecola litoralis]|uniref:Formimidoylglutamase n=1 Tax=Aliiglaciecola litoralis TaxID=582857 RepID=A0ABN1LS67_9ALTE